MESDVRIVSFMGDQSGLCEDLYRCKETGRVFIRQECDDTHVRWLTASKWRGDYEADCHLREGLTLRVVDKSGSILFEEATFQEEGVTGTWAQKVGPFSWEPPKALATTIGSLQKDREYRAPGGCGKFCNDRVYAPVAPGSTLQRHGFGPISWAGRHKLQTDDGGGGARCVKSSFVGSG